MVSHKLYVTLSIVLIPAVLVPLLARQQKADAHLLAAIKISLDDSIGLADYGQTRIRQRVTSKNPRKRCHVQQMHCYTFQLGVRPMSELPFPCDLLSDNRTGFWAVN